jgi:hypothetical protein
LIVSASALSYESPELVGGLAALPADDPEAWAAFASVYGFLREPQGHRVRVYGEGFPPSGRLVCAESVAVWREALYRLRFAVDLLGVIQANDQAALASWITLGSDGSAKYNAPDVAADWIVGFIGGSEHPLGPMIRRGGLVAAGWCAFQQIVNGSLNCRRQVLWDEHGRLRRFDVPQTLLGAAWMQLAEASEGGLIVRRCPRCGRSYPVRPTSRRKHDVYCSPACRVAAYRTRRKTRLLAAKAATPRRAASGKRPRK